MNSRMMDVGGMWRTSIGVMAMTLRIRPSRRCASSKAGEADGMTCSSGSA